MRRRLVIAIAGVATITVVLFALPLGVALKRTYRDEELLRLQRDAVAATRSTDTAGRRQDPIELPVIAGRVGVYGSGGRLLGGDGPSMAPRLLTETLRDGLLRTESRNGELTASVPLLTNERVSGALLAVRDDGAVDRRERDALIAMAGLAALIVLVAVAAALLTARRLTRPLERLAATAANLDRRELIDGIEPSGIPELDGLAEALSSATRRIEEMLIRERAFSSDASHQLRTPLAALRLELESLQLAGGPPPQVIAGLEQVDRLQTTIETLLVVARDAPRDSAGCNLVALADGAERRWRARLAAANRLIRVETESESISSVADSRVAEQILNVLVENAVLHGQGVVTLRVRALGGWAALEVVDQGEGFDGDPEIAFARRRRSADGHGIGLSLARSLAEAEGGSLRVSVAGPGPVVTLLLSRRC